MSIPYRDTWGPVTDRYAAYCRAHGNTPDEMLATVPGRKGCDAPEAKCWAVPVLAEWKAAAG